MSGINLATGELPMASSSVLELDFAGSSWGLSRFRNCILQKIREVRNVYDSQSNGRNRPDRSSCMLVLDVDQRDCLCTGLMLSLRAGASSGMYLIVSYTALSLKLYLVVSNRSVFFRSP
jgi:hypothetical protein